MTDDTLDDVRRRRTRLMALAGAVLLVLALVVALLLWMRPSEAGPDYRADCAVVEDTAPEYGADLQEIMQIQATDLDSRIDWVSTVSKRNRAMAAELTDRTFARQLVKSADEMDRLVADYRKGDVAAISRLPALLALVPATYHFLDDHCPRWLGPGVWDTPGASAPPSGIPTLPSDFPTLPSDLTMPAMPSGIASELGSGLPSNLPTMPSGIPSDLASRLPKDLTLPPMPGG